MDERQNYAENATRLKVNHQKKLAKRSHPLHPKSHSININKQKKNQEEQSSQGPNSVYVVNSTRSTTCLRKSISSLTYACNNICHREVDNLEVQTQNNYQDTIETQNLEVNPSKSCNYLLVPFGDKEISETFKNVRMVGHKSGNPLHSGFYDWSGHRTCDRVPHRVNSESPTRQM